MLVERTEPSWNNTLTLSLGIRQPLVFREAYRATITGIETSYTADRMEYQRIRNNLTLQAVRDYYAYKHAAYRVALIKTRLTGDKETYKKAQREYELGLRTKTQLYQAQSAVLQSEADLLKAEQGLEAARRVLSALYSIEVPENMDTSIAEFRQNTGTTDSLVQAALADNPELNTLRNSIEASRADMILKEKDHAAVLDAGLSYVYDRTLAEDADQSHSIRFNLGINSSISDGGAFR